MPITRSEFIERAATIWPLGHVPYSRMTVRNPGRMSSVTLVEDGYIREITPDELRPGTSSAAAGLAPAATPGTSSCSTAGTGYARRALGHGDGMARPDVHSQRHRRARPDRRLAHAAG